MERPTHLFRRLWLSFAGVVVFSSTLAVILTRRCADEEMARQLEARVRSFAQAGAALYRFDPALFTPAQGRLPINANLSSRLHPDLQLDFFPAARSSDTPTPAQTAEADLGPEVAAALLEGESLIARWSYPQARELLYAAARVGPAEDPIGVVRAWIPASASADRGSPPASIIAMGVSVIGCGLAALISMLWTEYLLRLDGLRRRRERDRPEPLPVAAPAPPKRSPLPELLAHLRDGVLICDTNGRIRMINPAASRLLDLPSDAQGGASAYLGKPIEACVPLLELQEMLRSPGADSSHAPSREERRVEIPRRGGSIFLLASSHSLELDAEAEHGPCAARLLVLTDISELSRVVQVKIDLVANASHELRTPIAAIRTAAETAKSLDLLSDQATLRRCMDIIDRHTTWLEQLVRDLLDLSKLESPDARFRPENVDLKRFCDELFERFASALEAKHIELRVGDPGPDSPLNVNPGLLRMVLDNLVENAIKFTPDGGRVSLGWRGAGTDVEFVVEDTGCGIPSEDRARVFERFYQVERSRHGAGSYPNQPRGTGLGLSIVRHAVVAMRGRVELESTLGKGTRVTVTVPRAVDHAAQPAPEASA